MMSPCKGCQNRTETCHAICDLYFDYVQRNEELKKEKQKARDKDRWQRGHLDRICKKRPSDEIKVFKSHKK